MRPLKQGSRRYRIRLFAVLNTRIMSCHTFITRDMLLNRESAKASIKLVEVHGISSFYPVE